MIRTMIIKATTSLTPIIMIRTTPLSNSDNNKKQYKIIMAIARTTKKQQKENNRDEKDTKIITVKTLKT